MDTRTSPAATKAAACRWAAVPAQVAGWSWAQLIWATSIPACAMRRRLGVGESLAGQGHHDLGRPPRAHGTEDVAGVGIKDVLAVVEGVVGRLEVPCPGTSRSAASIVRAACALACTCASVVARGVTSTSIRSF